MTAARLTVCVGGGGVGKTTCSAALALHLARSGKRTLVVTVDPARRLADALGVELGHETRLITVDASAEGRLYAKMPDPRIGMGELILALFDDPEQQARVRANPAFRELSDSLAGVHEMLTVGLVQGEVDSGRFDEVVLDTAPSRNALAFLDYPARLLGLLEAKALSWLSTLADGAPKAKGSRGLLAWGKAVVEGAMGRVVGLEALRNLSALFGEMLSVREHWATSVRRSQELLAHPQHRYLVIGVPTGGSLADVRFLTAELQRRSLPIAALVLNRAAVNEGLGIPVASLGALEIEDREPLLSALSGFSRENAARVTATNSALLTIRSFAPSSTGILRLPLLPPSPPQAMVLALADVWRDIGYSI